MSYSQIIIGGVIGVAAGLSVSLRDATVPLFGSGRAVAAVAVSAFVLIRKWRTAR